MIEESNGSLNSKKNSKKSIKKKIIKKKPQNPKDKKNNSKIQLSPKKNISHSVANNSINSEEKKIDSGNILSFFKKLASDPER